MSLPKKKNEARQRNESGLVFAHARGTLAVAGVSKTATGTPVSLLLLLLASNYSDLHYLGEV